MGREESMGASQEILVCPSCRSKCRARAGSTRTLRCPRCGTLLRSAPEPVAGGARSAIEAPRPRPETRPAADDEEDAGGYAAHAPARTRPVEEPEPDEVENIEVRRKRPPAPRLPLWWGVYGFPWHPSALRAWFLFGFGLTLVALMAAGLHYVIDLYVNSDMGVGSIWSRVFILYMKGFVLFLLWTGTFASGFFLATIQDTAAGNPKVDWPDDSIWEKFLTFFYLLWIFLCAAVPFGIAAAPLQGELGFGIFAWSLVPSAIFVLPFVLLCALTNNSWWMFWNTDIVRNLLGRPVVLLVLYVMSAVLVAPCVALGYLTIMHYDSFVFLAPLTGFVWSACLLIYGRLLGRVGWVISGEHELAQHEARRQKKRKRLRTS